MGLFDFLKRKKPEATRFPHGKTVDEMFAHQRTPEWRAQFKANMLASMELDIESGIEQIVRRFSNGEIKEYDPTNVRASVPMFNEVLEGISIDGYRVALRNDDAPEIDVMKASAVERIVQILERHAAQTAKSSPT